MNKLNEPLRLKLNLYNFQIYPAKQGAPGLKSQQICLLRTNLEQPHQNKKKLKFRFSTELKRISKIINFSTKTQTNIHPVDKNAES